MNFVKNLKSSQLRNLFIRFKSGTMQNFNIFGVRENFLFEFTNLRWIGNLNWYYIWPGPPVSGPSRFIHAHQSPRHVSPATDPVTTRWLRLGRRARRRRSPPVITAAPCHIVLIPGAWVQWRAPPLFISPTGTLAHRRHRHSPSPATTTSSHCRLSQAKASPWRPLRCPPPLSSIHQPHHRVELHYRPILPSWAHRPPLSSMHPRPRHHLEEHRTTS
jgi:hypothetical protein